MTTRADGFGSRLALDRDPLTPGYRIVYFGEFVADFGAESSPLGAGAQHRLAVHT